jgi:cysteine desulfuration protein SufE
VIPLKIATIVDAIKGISDRQERIEALISLAGKFREVPSEIASRPYPESNKVPSCESQAYVFVVKLDGGGYDVHFAVENPQGVSAKALAALLKQASGSSSEEILAIDEEIVYDIFGKELSMGKSAGLTEMIRTVKALLKAS